ncbi:hypothetical protein PROFUN_03444 [Planoprotostelium fungivorum]|uniref:Uncharacterized protein n=1 Tax=Planoprotostelium fungivorum TaxID=1890364 RepID=A0A2P6MN44_9EUKA|nr:hypothetical protein PROFUN_03444 [Planoprotostelium fungivorum]
MEPSEERFTAALEMKFCAFLDVNANFWEWGVSNQVYPAEVFEKRRFLSIPVLMSRSPLLNDYISESLATSLEDELRVFLGHLGNIDQSISPRSTDAVTFEIAAHVDVPAGERRYDWIKSGHSQLHRSQITPIRSTNLGSFQLQLFVEKPREEKEQTIDIEMTSSQELEDGDTDGTP